METNGMEELRGLVTRLAVLVNTIGEQQQQTHADLGMMAERWDNYIVEQRQMNARWDAMAERWDSYIVEQRQMNARLQAILERLLPGSGNGRAEA
jgi:hypothetical protein